MSKWKEYKLREIGKVITGKTPSFKNPEHWGDIMPFVTPTDFDAYNKTLYDSIRHLSNDGIKTFERNVLPKNSIIVTCIGSQMGKVVINKVKCVTNQQINSIIIGKEFSPDYIYYVLSSMQGYLRNLATGGSTMPIVNKSAFENITIYLPDLPAQTAIAEILSSLDDKIELNNAINKNLEDLAQALFKQWFVDFEFPNENGEPYQSSGGEMMESELGMIPKGWKLDLLDNILELIIDHRGKTPLKIGHQWSKDGVVALSARNVKDRGLYNLENVHIGSEELYKVWMKNELQFGDILLTSEAPLGEIALLLNKHKFILSQRLFALRPKKNVGSFYLFEWLSSVHGKDELERRASGSTVIGIKQSELRKIRLLIPRVDIISDYSSYVQDLYQKIEETKIENEQLISLRDTLLPKLISGELSVIEAEEMIEQADVTITY